MTDLRYWIALIIIVFGFSSCDKEESFISAEAPVINLDITEIPKVNFNDEITVSGTATSENAVRDISFYLVKKDTAGYERLWFSPLQYADIMIGKFVDFEAKVVIDDPEADAITVSVSDPYGGNTIDYVTIGQIEGAPSGSAYVFKDIELASEYEYGGSKPYVFSLTGVNVDGTTKNILSLDEIKKTNARNLDFAFVNIWRNTTNYTAGVLGNWGYAFCAFNQLARGPIGRQCDYIYLTGDNAIPEGTDTCCMALVSNAFANSNNFEEVFKNAGDNFGTSNFLNVLESLFPSDAVGSKYVVNLKSNASGISTSDCKENVTAGSYIAFCKVKNKTERSYGLIQVISLPDVSDAVDETGLKYKPEPYIGGVVDNAHLPNKWYSNESVQAEGVAKLYGRSVKINVIAQK